MDVIGGDEDHVSRCLRANEIDWDPPSGCAFQTRCRWKSQVPDGLCEREMPAVRTLPDNHKIKCHLTDEQLATMEPVIKIAAAE